MGFGFTELECVVFFKSGDALVAEGGLIGKGEGDGLAVGAVFGVVAEECDGGYATATRAEGELQLIVP